MLKIFIIICVFICSLTAIEGTLGENLFINALKFFANENDNIILFEGNVTMKKNMDIIKADKITIILNDKQKGKKRKALNYTAIGNVNVEIITKKSHYVGKGDEVIYDPKSNIYIINGNSFVEDKNEIRKLYGDKILIDTLNGEARIDGTIKKPIRFIMELDTVK